MDKERLVVVLKSGTQVTVWVDGVADCLELIADSLRSGEEKPLFLSATCVVFAPEIAAAYEMPPVRFDQPMTHRPTE